MTGSKTTISIIDDMIIQDGKTMDLSGKPQTTSRKVTIKDSDDVCGESVDYWDSMLTMGFHNKNYRRELIERMISYGKRHSN